MRQLLTILACVAACLPLTGCGAQPESAPAAPSATSKPQQPLLLSAHFAGQTGGTNASNLRAVLQLPSTTNYLNFAFNQLATLPFALAGESPASTNVHQAELRPLLDDVIRSESFLEIRGPSFTNAELTFAIKLEPARAKVWSTTLHDVLADWTGIKATTTANGWELKKHHAPNLVRLAVNNGWLFLGLGQDALPNLEAFLKQLPAADTNALSLWADAGKYHAGWPQAKLTWNGEGQSLRVRGTFDFPAALDFKNERWLVPTNLIREPLIGFSATQDPLAGWLQGTEFFRQISDRPLTHQFFGWAQSQAPFQMFLISPSTDVTNDLAKLAPRLVELGKRHIPPAIGIVHATSNNSSAYWEGLPFIVPYLSTAKDSGRDYLLLGMFGNSNNTNRMPAELLAHVADRTNLVYYDWEDSRARLGPWHQLNQLFRMISHRPMITTNAPGYQFLTGAAVLLGSTATEITLTGTNQLSLTRRSDLGFTAFELSLLNEWLSSSRFPHTDIVWPPKFAPQKTVPPGYVILSTNNAPHKLAPNAPVNSTNPAVTNAPAPKP